MRIETACVRTIAYPMRPPILTTRGVLAERRGFRVLLAGAGGLQGVGEALPLESAGTEDLGACREAVHALARALEGARGALEELLDRLEEAAPAAPAARCAFDGALHDLEGQQRGCPVARLLAARPRRSLEVNALIGSQDTGAALREARDALARGHRTLKLKVGVRGPREDRERLEALRHGLERTRPDLRLRIDANGAWTAAGAVEILEQIAPLGVELVEQPVPPRDLEGLARVHAASPIPVAVDETLAHEEGRQAALEGKLGAIAVLKPMVLGGARAGSRFAAGARPRGVRCLVTTTFEGAAGSLLAAHLGAAAADPDLACGIALAGVPESQTPPGLRPRRGRIHLPAGGGLGWRPAR